MNESSAINKYVKVRPLSNIRNRKKNLFVVSLLAIPILHFLIFWVYVNFRTILLTVQNYDAFEGQYVWYGLMRYADVFEELFLSGKTALWRGFMNSLASVAFNWLILLPVAFFSAYAFYKKIPGERAFRVIFFFPSMISIIVLTMSFKYMFNAEFGPVAAFFRMIGYSPDWLSTTQSSQTIWPLIWTYCIWAGLGSNVILLSGAMMRIPYEITESVRLDGCGFWKEMIKITIPLVMPTITTFVLTGMLGLFGFMLQPMLIAGGPGEAGKTQTIAYYIFDVTSSNSTESSQIHAATVGTLLSVLCVPFIFVVKWAMNKLTPDVSF